MNLAERARKHIDLFFVSVNTFTDNKIIQLIELNLIGVISAWPKFVEL